MDTQHTLKKIITGASLSGAVAVAGLGLAAGTAQAQPGCSSYACWCPGQPLPGRVSGGWDMNACHDWHWAWHDDRNAQPNTVLSGPLDCSYGPGFLPPCVR